MAEPKRYVLVRNGVNEGPILWDGVTPFDPGPGTQLVEESKYSGPAPPAAPVDATAERLAKLEAQMTKVGDVPEVKARIPDMGAVKGLDTKAGR